MAESPTAACHFRVVASIATACTWRCRPTMSTCSRQYNLHFTFNVDDLLDYAFCFDFKLLNEDTFWVLLIKTHFNKE